MGFGCLTRGEKRAVESNLLQAYRNYIHRDHREGGTGLSQTATHAETNTRTSSISKFLDSIGKKTQSPSSSSNTLLNNINSLSDELSTYRSLAQKEYNSIVLDKKEPHVISFIQLNYSKNCKPMHFILTDSILAEKSVPFATFIANCIGIFNYSSYVCCFRKCF